MSDQLDPRMIIWVPPGHAMSMAGCTHALARWHGGDCLIIDDPHAVLAAHMGESIPQAKERIEALEQTKRMMRQPDKEEREQPQINNRHARRQRAAEERRARA